MTKPLPPEELAQVTTWRRHIHTHPEIAFKEHETAKMVAELLTSFGYEVHTRIGKTGVVGVMTRGQGRNIALRADMDALPIHERNEFAHKSCSPGMMHACGHDGHTAMLLGAAKALAADETWSGTLTLIFQPAEEIEGGALAMLEDGLFERFPVDAVFGLHNWPGLPAGQIAVHDGPVMAAFDLFEITLTGQGGHGAMPHLGTDTMVAASQLVSHLQTIVSRRIDPLEAAVVSVTQIHGGDAWNVLPAKVTLKGGTRHFSKAVGQEIERSIRQLTQLHAEAAGLEATVTYEPRYAPTINSLPEAQLAADAAASVVGTENVLRTLPPSMGSEDFGAMLEVKPGAYIWLGNDRPDGANHGLHHDLYDFNDEIIAPGVGYWRGLVGKLLTA